MTREQELEKAIDKAALPPRDYRIYRALFKRADWKTGVIPARWQPRSLKDIMRDTGLSKATVCRGLDHLEGHGWIARRRSDPGAGHATVYELMAGMDCDCLKVRGEPKSDAERARRYRERRKVSHRSVTQDTGSVSDLRDGRSQIDVTKGLASRDDSPGQRPFPAKEGRDEGRGERGEVWTDPDQKWMAAHTWPEHLASWPGGSIGEQVNRSTDTIMRRAA